MTTIKLADLARELHIDPRKARSILRSTPRLPKRIDPKHWIFDARNRERLLKLLSRP